MTSFIVPSEASTGLPLVRLRLFYLLLTLVFFVVARSLTLAVFTSHADAQKLINENVPSGVSVQIEYSDVRVATVALCVLTHITSAVIFPCTTFLLNDIYHYIPLRIARILRIADKEISTITLPHQTVTLVFLFILNAISLGFLTFITFTRQAIIRVRYSDDIMIDAELVPQILRRLEIPTAYRDMQHVRIAAVLPWIAVILLIPTTLVTFAACRQRRIFTSPSRRATSPPLPEENKAEAEVKMAPSISLC